MMAQLYKPGRPSKQEPPEKPGIYRWRNKETGDIDYIGETNNLKRRENQHERTKIEQHKPSLNQRAGGAGRKTR